MTHAAAASPPPRPIRLVRLTCAIWLLSTIPALIVYGPDVSAGLLGVQGGIGLALVGIDLPWRRIPWGMSNQE